MLMYSTLFGLTEVNKVADVAPFGTYIRCYEKTGTSLKWYVMSKHKLHRGTTPIWKEGPIALLPKRLKAEALLLGITL